MSEGTSERPSANRSKNLAKGSHDVNMFGVAAKSIDMHPNFRVCCDHWAGPRRDTRGADLNPVSPGCARRKYPKEEGLTIFKTSGREFV